MTMTERKAIKADVGIVELAKQAGRATQVGRMMGGLGSFIRRMAKSNARNSRRFCLRLKRNLCVKPILFL